MSIFTLVVQIFVALCLSTLFILFWWLWFVKHNFPKNTECPGVGGGGVGVRVVGGVPCVWASIFVTFQFM